MLAKTKNTVNSSHSVSHGAIANNISAKRASPKRLWDYTQSVSPYQPLQSNQVKRTPQESNNEFIIPKLNPLLVVDFRLISAFLYV